MVVYTHVTGSRRKLFFKCLANMISPLIKVWPFPKTICSRRFTNNISPFPNMFHRQLVPFAVWEHYTNRDKNYLRFQNYLLLSILLCSSTVIALGGHYSILTCQFKTAVGMHVAKLHFSNGTQRSIWTPFIQCFGANWPYKFG